jgi:hypothetical protein
MELTPEQATAIGLAVLGKLVEDAGGEVTLDQRALVARDRQLVIPSTPARAAISSPFR